MSESSKIAFTFYDQIASPVKSGASSCQFYPSCSEYSRQAIKKYGFTVGLALTCDRFMRCSGGHSQDNRYPMRGKLFIDLPENNYIVGSGALWNMSTQIDLSTPNSASDSSHNADFSFEKHLFLESDYSLSILELKRRKFFEKNPEIMNKIDLLLVSNYIVTNNLEKATDLILNIKNKDSATAKDYFRLRYILADQKALNAWNINNCNEEIASTNDSSLVRFLIFAEFKSNNMEQCESLSQNYSIKYPNLPKLMSIAIDKERNISRKSPLLAGLMSTVLPGSGYLYAGSVKEGLSAFLVNGLLGAGIYSLFKNHNTGSGILLSAVSASFYFGNIIGSVNSAKLSNQQQIDIIQSELRTKLGLDYYFSKAYLMSIYDK